MVAVMTTSISPITVDPTPTSEKLLELGVQGWPTWSKEVSTFPWTYEHSETCYFLAGKVIVTPSQGDTVQVGTGDLVTFPAGLSCTWQVLEPVRKHYRFH